MSDIAQAYVELAHAIEQHNPGYIDGYFGPDAWKGNGKRPLPDLARAAEELAAVVAALPAGERRSFLEGQVRAMGVSIALLQGEAIPYRAEVRGLYDIEIERVPEAIFDEAIAALDELLPGTGDIAAREQAFREQFEVPSEQIPALVEPILVELHRRTRERFELPEGEAFEVKLVQNEPWAAYNWYLGNYRSRIDINTDLPKTLTDLPGLMAHEAYPGHHTEHAIKEKRLLHDQGRGEHTILLINAPECVISEGIATRARRVVISDEELVDWLKHDLVGRAGLGDVDIERMLELHKAKQGMRLVTGNAALLLHDEGASEEEVIAYLQRYRLARPEEARKSISFITHPNFRSYTYTYTAGGDLLDELFATGNEQAWFARLLYEPVTPSVVRGWIAEAKGAATNGAAHA